MGICILGSAIAYAAIKYLTPSQVAIRAPEDSYLAAAFEEKQAVRINEQKKEDGTAMPRISDAEYGMDRFLVSPLIGDQDPMRVNLYSLDGFAAEIVHEGIAYRIISCKELDMLADRGVYLAVCHELNDLENGYETDADKGQIACREDFAGLNLLFELPLDSKAADREAAERVLTEIKAVNAGEAVAEDEKTLLSEESASPQDLKEWLLELEAGMQGNEVVRRCHIVAGRSRAMTMQTRWIPCRSVCISTIQMEQ